MRFFSIAFFVIACFSGAYAQADKNAAQPDAAQCKATCTTTTTKTSASCTVNAEASGTVGKTTTKTAPASKAKKAAKPSVASALGVEGSAKAGVTCVTPTSTQTVNCTVTCGDITPANGGGGSGSGSGGGSGSSGGGGGGPTKKTPSVTTKKH